MDQVPTCHTRRFFRRKSFFKLRLNFLSKSMKIKLKFSEDFLTKPKNVKSNNVSENVKSNNVSEMLKAIMFQKMLKAIMFQKC